MDDLGHLLSERVAAVAGEAETRRPQVGADGDQPIVEPLRVRHDGVGDSSQPHRRLPRVAGAHEGVDRAVRPLQVAGEQFHAEKPGRARQQHRATRGVSRRRYGLPSLLVLE